MATDDRCVTIVPYFEVKDGELENVRPYFDRFVDLTRSEKGCLFYGFSFNGNKFHCREGYADADAALTHLGNVGPLLTELLESGKVEMTDLQVHGPAQELAKLREPMAAFAPSYWVLEYGFRS